MSYSSVGFYGGGTGFLTPVITVNNTTTGNATSGAFTTGIKNFGGGFGVKVTAKQRALIAAMKKRRVKGKPRAVRAPSSRLGFGFGPKVVQVPQPPAAPANIPAASASSGGGGWTSDTALMDEGPADSFDEDVLDQPAPEVKAAAKEAVAKAKSNLPLILGAVAIGAFLLLRK